MNCYMWCIYRGQRLWSSNFILFFKNLYILLKWVPEFGGHISSQAIFFLYRRKENTTKFNLEEITSGLFFIYFVHIQIKDLLFSCNQHHQSELPPKRVAKQKNSTPGISIIEITNCYSLMCSSDHFQLQVARISTSMSLRNKRKFHWLFLPLSFFSMLLLFSH